MVSSKVLDQWMPMVVACGVAILTALGNAWVLLWFALASMVVMAILYRLAGRHTLGVALSAVSAAVILGAMILLWSRSRH